MQKYVCLIYQVFGVMFPVWPIGLYSFLWQEPCRANAWNPCYRDLLFDIVFQNCYGIGGILLQRGFKGINQFCPAEEIFANCYIT